LTIKTARQLKFSKLDETASRTEVWLKSKVIIGLVAAAILQLDIWDTEICCGSSTRGEQLMKCL
jgi:hypothetical protein